MKRLLLTVLVLKFVLLGALIVEASAVRRTFTFKSGATFEGEFVSFKDNQTILVRTKDGKIATISTPTLSEADQTYLTEIRESKKGITGAFGIELGQKFLPQSATSKFDAGFGDLPQYGFKPREPVSYFSEYRVSVTPLSNQVCAIRALGKFNWEKGYDVRQRLLTALEEKYGKSVHRKHAQVDIEYDTITLGNRSVEILYAAEPNITTISIAYEDKVLEAKAKTESGGKERGDLKKKL